MLSLGFLVLAKRLAGKKVSKMIYLLPSEMLNLILTQICLMLSDMCIDKLYLYT